MPVPTSRDITESLLSLLKTKIDASPDEKVLQILLNEFEQLTDMIRDGYQFSDSDLKNLPQVIEDAVKIRVDAQINRLKSVEVTFFKKDSNGFSPLWLGGTDKEPVNLDEVSITGMYEVYIANSPTRTWGYLQHFEHRHANKCSVQIWYSFYHSNTWIRRQNQGVWSEWIKQ